MKKENIIEVLNYIIENEYEHYLECLSNNVENNAISAENHIFMIALRAKHDLMEGLA